MSQKLHTHKILVVCHTSPPPGGMETYVEHMFESYLVNKYDMRLFDTRKRTRPDRFLLTGILSQFIILMQYLFCLFDFQPDLVHIHTASRLYFYRRSIDLLLAKILNKKVILHVHGAGFKTFWQESHKIGKIFIKFILQLSDYTIALSDNWKNTISKMEGNSDKIYVIPNGIDTKPFNKKNNIGIDKNCYVKILFVGSLGKRKGIHDIIDILPSIVNSHRNCGFIIVGNEEYPGIIQELLNILPPEYRNHIIFKGALFGNRKIEQYLDADVFVLPSYAENFPLVMLEAMAAGLPLVISRVGAIPYVIKDELNGLLVDPGDKQALMKALNRLIVDSSLRIRIGEFNKLESRKYDFQITARRIDEIYELTLSD